MQNAYQQWRFFPPDRFTFTGSPEAGRIFTSAEFPPATSNFSEIDLDPIYGGPVLPCGGPCQLITSCLTNVPHFGESLRVLDLSGQCVSPEQVSQLFSETLSPRLPKLKSASLRLIATELALSTRNTVAPPEIEHLQLNTGIHSPQFTRQMLQPLMPIIRKVKHLGWYCCVFRGNDMAEIFGERLGSLKILETTEEIMWHFGTFPSDTMPSLERLLVHYYQFSYSVELEQVYRSIGQPFTIEQAVFNEYKQHKVGLRNTTAILYLRDSVVGVEDIHSTSKIHEIKLYPSDNWAFDLLECEILPIMSTLENLESVVVKPNRLFAHYSSLGQRFNINQLHKAFQFPSVRQLKFMGETEDISGDLHITFLRMFPNLETLVNPPIQCFKERQVERDVLPCPRKLVLLHAQAAWNGEIVKCLHQWQNLDAFCVQYQEKMLWPTELMVGLAKHRNLRHLCIIIDATSRKRKACNLPTREMVEGLAEAWKGRDWVSILLIWHPVFKANPTTVVFSAMHHDDGSIKYGEMRGVSFQQIVLSFPQFYTIFWQHVHPQLYPI